MKTLVLVLTFALTSSVFAQEVKLEVTMPVDGTVIVHEKETGRDYVFTNYRENFRADAKIEQYPSAKAIGGKDGGGGDPSIMWRSILKIENAPRFEEAELSFAAALFLDDQNNNFRARLASVLMTLPPSSIKNFRVRRAFEAMLKDGLVQDIADSQVRLRNLCFIEIEGVKLERAATSLMNAKGTDICVDPVRMAKGLDGFARSSVLFGLMFHEYAHHFGHLDLDHSMAIEIARALEATQGQRVGYDRERRGKFKGEDTLYVFSLQARAEKASSEAQHWLECLGERNCFND